MFDSTVTMVFVCEGLMALSGLAMYWVAKRKPAGIVSDYNDIKNDVALLKSKFNAMNPVTITSTPVA